MNGLTALPMLVASHSPFDLCILMLGTNDLKNRFSVSPSDIAASLERLVVNLRFLCNAPGRTQPKVLLIAPPPIQEVDWLGDKFIGGAEKSQRLGVAIRRSVDRLGTTFLDAGEHIAVSPIDGLH